jgi:hypothetical protein
MRRMRVVGRLRAVDEIQRSLLIRLGHKRLQRLVQKLRLRLGIRLGRNPRRLLVDIAQPAQRLAPGVRRLGDPEASANEVAELRRRSVNLPVQFETKLGLLHLAKIALGVVLGQPLQSGLALLSRYIRRCSRTVSASIEQEPQRSAGPYSRRPEAACSSTFFRRGTALGICCRIRRIANRTPRPV